ncbi:MAG: glycosyltransferase family 2 protein [Candidatus Roizmanbacteria bacterium]|nr:glycosyltransferase family 2 protein [Candidatus Roizmanbacteria bacterium]
MQKTFYPKKWQLPGFETHEFAEKKTKYCIAVPLINEGQKFKKQLSRMKQFADLADILIFDGGSTDGSTNHTFLKKNGVRTLLIKTGEGRQGAQLRMGFAYALQQGYEGIITIDGNGKDDVSAIPHFINKLEEGFDFVQGSRFITGGKAINTPFARLIGIRVIHAPLISLAAGYWYTDTTNGFRAYSRNYLLHRDVQPFRDIFNTYDLLFYLNVRAPQLKLRVKEIPVIRAYPKGKIPTKITGLHNLDVINTVLKILFGHYHP